MSTVQKVELQGYDVADALVSTYTRPILVLGPEGLGKRTWCHQTAEDQEIVTFQTNSLVGNLRNVERYFQSAFKFAWVLELVEVSGHIATYDKLVSTLKRSADSGVRVFAYASWDVPDVVLDVCDVVNVPLFTDEQMRELCVQQGFAPDETNFAVSAARGIPGDALKSFEVLRSRTNILSALEHVRDDNHSGLNKCISDASAGDVKLLKEIARSLDTGEWVYFSENDVEPLLRVRRLMDNVLYNFSKATPEVIFACIFSAAQHAFQGRI